MISMSAGETTPDSAPADSPNTTGMTFLLAALALALDVYLGAGLASQLRTAWYSPTVGVISSSEVISQSASRGGTVHAPKIAYNYVWGSRTFKGDHYAADDSSFSSDSWAADLVAQLSPGTKVPVYVSPADARRAVLRHGLDGGDLLWPLFALPVNLLAVGAFASARRAKGSSAPTAVSPLRTALTALGALGIALPVLVLITVGSHPPSAVTGIAWLIAVIVTVVSYGAVRHRVRASSSSNEPSDA